MVVEQPATAVGDGNQLHLAAALGATNRSFGRWFGNGLLCQQVTPAQIKPDQHLNPGEFQPAVLAGVTVVPQLLKVGWQRVLEESAYEFFASYVPCHAALRIRWSKTISHACFINRQNVVVTDGHAMHVRGKVLVQA